MYSSAAVADPGILEGGGVSEFRGFRGLMVPPKGRSVEIFILTSKEQTSKGRLSCKLLYVLIERGCLNSKLTDNPPFYSCFFSYWLG